MRQFHRILFGLITLAAGRIHGVVISEIHCNPPATILPGRGFRVVALDAAAIAARYGISNLLGN